MTRWGWVLVLISLVGGPVWGQVPLAPAVSPDAVVELVQGLSIPDDVKAQAQGELLAAMADGRLTPGVAFSFLSEIQDLSPGDQTDAVTTLDRALERGLILDPLLNEALKGLRLGRPWPEVQAVLSLRINLLIATDEVFRTHRLLPLQQFEVRAPQPSPPPRAELVLETAWAIGDYLVAGGSPADVGPITSLVETRLTRLRGRVLPADLVDPVLASVSPALVQEIMELALNPERR